MQDDIYWSDWHSQSVLKVQYKPDTSAAAAAADGSPKRRPIQRVAGGLISPFGLQLMHNSRQPMCKCSVAADYLQSYLTFDATIVFCVTVAMSTKCRK